MPAFPHVRVNNFLFSRPSVAANRAGVAAHRAAFARARNMAQRVSTRTSAMSAMAERVDRSMAEQMNMAGRIDNRMNSMRNVRMGEMASRVDRDGVPFDLVTPRPGMNPSSVRMTPIRNIGAMPGRSGGVDPLAQTMAAASPSMTTAAAGIASPVQNALGGAAGDLASSMGSRMLAGGAMGAWTGSDQGTGGMLAGAAAGALLGGAGWNRAAGAVTNMGFTKNWQRMAIGAGGTYFGASAASSMFGSR